MKPSSYKIKRVIISMNLGDTRIVTTAIIYSLLVALNVDRNLISIINEYENLT